jgi:hypothetical protein
VGVEETVHICELCREILADDEPVITAVRMHHLERLGSIADIEGIGVFFHLCHWPEGSFRFRFRARTTVRQGLRDPHSPSRGDE